MRFSYFFSARQQKNLFLMGTLLCGSAGFVMILLLLLQDNIVFFYTPQEIQAKFPGGYPKGKRLRIGGLVKAGSIETPIPGTIHFILTDKIAEMHIHYTGMLPDLFREGQGIVAEGGLLAPNIFQADMLLAKHDERYQPRGVPMPEVRP